MKKNSAILGAAFLMATSAIGPGFLTQTTKFTGELMASFGFVILISVLIDIGAQLNTWRIVTMSGERAQDIANKTIPGSGCLLATLVAAGGLIFNTGNIAGCGMGLNVLTGLKTEYGAVISCAIALGLFWYKEAGKLMDQLVKILGLLMIGLTVYVAFASQPPLGEALQKTVWPDRVNIFTIITLVGGTVGGYISFAGAHRLVDAGIKGEAHLKEVSRSAVSGILITAIMRFILFLAALGAVWSGTKLAAGNPAVSVFQSAAGEWGVKIFGMVLWCAAITSVIGASYTSVSFWKTLLPAVNRHQKLIISLFIILSTLVFAGYGNPVKVLVFAGAANGLILPVSLAIMLLAVYNKKLFPHYTHPRWMQVIGWIVVLVMGWMSVEAIRGLFR